MLKRFLWAAALAVGLSSHAGAQSQGQAVNPVDRRGNPFDSTNPLPVVAQAGSTMPGGLTTYRVLSPAGSGAQVIKATAGRVYSFNMCNSAAASRYVRFYNSASATTGTTPVFAGAIVISASSCQQFTTNFGLTFGAGISFSVTAANGDADTTAAAAGDVSGFIGFM